MTDKTIPRLGILLLDTAFPRVPGDIGNAASWPFPVAYEVVSGATPEAIVANDPRKLLAQFVSAGKKLVAQGCTGITTTCGFLSLLQDDLKSALGVPVATSALMQIASINALLPLGQRTGVVTISAQSLTAAHLLAAGAPADTPLIGTDTGSFSASILNNLPELDTQAAAQEIRRAALTLCADHPELGALVLECTNMPPYAAAVARATGLPVYSIHSFLCWFHAGLAPPTFGAPFPKVTGPGLEKKIANQP